MVMPKFFRVAHDGASMLVLSQVLAQGLLLAVTPLITRHYSSAAIGAYQLLLSLSLVLTPLATLRVELPIPGPVSHLVVARLRRWGLLGLTCFSAVMLFGALVAGLVAQDAHEWLAVLVLVVAAGSMAIDNALLMRRGQYARLATRNILSGTLGAAFQLVASQISDSGMALVAAVALGRFLALVATASLRHDIPEFEAEPGNAAGSPRELLASIASGVISTLGSQLPILVLGLTLTADALGQLSVAMRLSAAPLALLGVALTQVVAAVLGIALRAGDPNVSRLFRRYFVRISALAFLSALAVVVLGLGFADLVLGPGWREAGQLASLLAVAGFAQLAVVPFLGLFAMLGKSARLARVQAYRVAVLAVLLLVLSMSGLDLLVVMAVYAVATVLLYGLLAVKVDRQLSEYVARPSREFRSFT